MSLCEGALRRGRGVTRSGDGYFGGEVLGGNGMAEGEGRHAER
jgi:hypothetical protein